GISVHRRSGTSFPADRLYDGFVTASRCTVSANMPCDARFAADLQPLPRPDAELLLLVPAGGNGIAGVSAARQSDGSGLARAAPARLAKARHEFFSSRLSELSKVS